jgi:hypothetical protein
MTFLHFYVRKRKVIIPTVAQTDEGFFIDVAPVEMLSANRTSQLRDTLTNALTSGNKQVQTPEAGDPGSVVLEAVGIKRWEAFEKQSALYTIFSTTGSTTVYVTGRGEDGMWTQDKANETVFPAETPKSDIIEWIINDIARRPEANEPESRLPMLLPSPEQH